VCLSSPFATHPSTLQVPCPTPFATMSYFPGQQYHGGQQPPQNGYGYQQPPQVLLPMLPLCSCAPLGPALTRRTDHKQVTATHHKVLPLILLNHPTDTALLLRNRNLSMVATNNLLQQPDTAAISRLLLHKVTVLLQHRSTDMDPLHQVPNITIPTQLTPGQVLIVPSSTSHSSSKCLQPRKSRRSSTSSHTSAKLWLV
jgi:hypothetical protein